ncbi:divergent polysaccharide deacetylase family protein [Ruegeria profundi]|uniref:divergent polysaccharide deacetylase family protein n=1 Tax=Ruegeria profundi TaxID=1685378 RepID=UPI001CD2A8D9|nr:divergent polysaccharide deacetylase family protein [Ruegeria profundi]MCA0927131.1 divergent polysaccharide deacetylase family protein [Ruegeria profundi]
MGGFVGGMIVGTIVVLALGAVLSLNAPLTNEPDVAVTAPAPEAVEVPETVADATDAVSDADVLDLAPTTPKAIDDQTDTLAELSDVELEPEAQPELKEAAKQVDAPSIPSSTAVSVATEVPVAPQAPPLAQASPSAEALPEVSLVVPEPQPAPIAEAEPETINAESQPNAEVATPEQSAEPEVTETEAKPEPKVAEVEPQTDPKTAEVEPQPQPEASDVEPQPEPEVAAVDKPEEDVNPFVDSPIAVEGDEDTAPRDLPRIASVPQIGGTDETSSIPTVGKRVLPLTERDDVTPVSSTTSDTLAPRKPIEVFAAEFENPDDKPLMSIILIDDEGAYGAEALRDFPYPLSFAVSPSDPEAAEKMARHREAGFEVLALVDLPEAASAQDAEVSFAVWLDTLPETVGILEGVKSGIQGNRKLADQVAAIAAGTGRGLITQDNGLNTVQKLAARNGVPSSVIFRDIDGARQDAKLMRRFLDQAAFRAGQEGTVVMLGRVRPETISALLLWGLEDRGGRVAMAPISAVMMKEIR